MKWQKRKKDCSDSAKSAARTSRKKRLSHNLKKRDVIRSVASTANSASSQTIPNTEPITDREWIEGKSLSKLVKADGALRVYCKCGTIMTIGLKDFTYAKKKKLLHGRFLKIGICYFCRTSIPDFSKSQIRSYELWKEEKRIEWEAINKRKDEDRNERRRNRVSRIENFSALATRSPNGVKRNILRTGLRRSHVGQRFLRLKGFSIRSA